MSWPQAKKEVQDDSEIICGDDCPALCLIGTGPDQRALCAGMEHD